MNAPDSSAPTRQSLLANPVARGALLVGSFAFVVFLLTRIVLLLTLAREDANWDSSLLAAFATGVGFDLITSFYVGFIWVILSSLVANRATGIWRLVSLGILIFTVKWLLDGQGWIATTIVCCILSLPVLCTFGKRSGRIFTIVTVALFVASILFGAVSEWFFWEEFGVRFNFIAVDYLVYTQEVVANINESYPMPIIVSTLALVTAGILYFFHRKGWLTAISEAPFGWTRRVGTLVLVLAIFAASVFGVSQSLHPKFANNFNAELGKNGLYSFGNAFWSNEIDYAVFYQTKAIDQALAGCQKLLATPTAPIASATPGDLRRVIKREGEEKKWNVILVCIESLSGDYMGVLGNKRGLTPNLDRIANEGVFFKNLYATGTRTVRGMEALTLCIPPTPGQSLVRRKNCANLFSIGSLFAERGYDNAFLYGGNGIFDNMNAFFGGNGYRIVDRPKKSQKDVTFENAWGACDEDMFNWTMEEADRAHAAGKPFHYFCMTTSNHRPFTFPLNEVDLKDANGKLLTDGPKRTVKYTDFAVNKLLETAKTKPWFANTVFVIVADHCAFSAGKAELDVTKFHIPAILWNPQLIQPKVIVPMCSQIDVMPTLFGLMNWSYTTRFFGMDVLDGSYNEASRRAYVSNNQKVALLRENQMAILKPKKEYSLYDVDRRKGDLTPNPTLIPLLDEAIDYYQSASHLYKSGRLQSSVAEP